MPLGQPCIWFGGVDCPRFAHVSSDHIDRRKHSAGRIHIHSRHRRKAPARSGGELGLLVFRCRHHRAGNSGIHFGAVPEMIMLLLHAGKAIEPHDLWQAWAFEPGVVMALGLAAGLYVAGMMRMMRAPTANDLAFVLGWLALA